MSIYVMIIFVNISHVHYLCEATQRRAYHLTGSTLKESIMHLNHFIGVRFGIVIFDKRAIMQGSTDIDSFFVLAKTRSTSK